MNILPTPLGGPKLDNVIFRCFHMFSIVFKEKEAHSHSRALSFLNLFKRFFESSSLREASGTHLALISACSVRANSLYEVLPGVLRLVDRFFTVFYVSGPFFYRFLSFLYSVLSVFLPLHVAVFFEFFCGQPQKKKPKKTPGSFFLQLSFLSFLGRQGGCASSRLDHGFQVPPGRLH